MGSVGSVEAIECKEEILIDLEGDRGILVPTVCGDMALFFDNGMAFSDCLLTALDWTLMDSSLSQKSSPKIEVFRY
jgi:hypothetical protein